MANFVSGFSGGAIRGTAGRDIIVAVQTASGGGKTVEGGDENDVIFVGSQSILSVGGPGRNTFDTALEIGDDDSRWSTLPNPDIGDDSIPHTTVLASGFGASHFYRLTVGAGETLTVDVDYGQGSFGGAGFDATLVLYDQARSEVLRNEGDAVAAGGRGSVVVGASPNQSQDPYATITNTSGAAQTYFIEVTDAAANGVPIGGTYVLNVSLTGHGVGAPAPVLGDDSVNGGAGNDIIYTLDGADTIEGGAGNDQLLGGAGNDLFIYRKDDGVDRIVGGGGTDTLRVISSGPGETAVFANAMLLTQMEGIEITGDGPARLTVLASQLAGLSNGIDATGHLGEPTTLVVEMDGAAALDINTLTLAGLSEPGDAINILGSDVSEVLTGNDQANYIDGNAGDDLISGGLGVDWMTPGAGNDTVVAGTPSDMVSFIDLAQGAIIDLSAGTARSGTDVNVLTNVQNVTGTTFADYIQGDANDNRLRGQGDYDWFVGSDGDDNYDGGNGRDMISYVFADAGVTVNLDAGIGIAGQAEGDIYTSIERVTGSIYGDLIFGSSEEDDFRGLGGYDWFVGSGGGRDRYDGGSGRDMVSYASSDAGVTASLLLGYGTAGDAARDLYTSIERLTGTSYDDILTGDNGRNQLRGLYGEDVLIGNGGVDRLEGGGSDDMLYGGSGWDVAVFSGNRSEYTVRQTASGHIVEHSGRDGTDSLFEIEALQFADGLVFL